MVRIVVYSSAELQRRRELGIVFRKRDKGSGRHIEDKEEKLKYSVLIKSNCREIFMSINHISLSILADVFGTLEALTKIINLYKDTRCPLDVVSTGVGPVNEDDLEAAELFNGLYSQ